jgi:hypothetical protein
VQIASGDGNNSHRWPVAEHEGEIVKCRGMKRQLPTLVAVLCIFLFMSGCVSHDAPNQSGIEFKRLYSVWHHDLATEGDGSDNATMEIRRQSYRNIVAMGKPALPFLEKKLIEDKGADALLAFAIVEICGWNIHDFQGTRSGREFRDNVVKKLREEKMIPDN